MERKEKSANIYLKRMLCLSRKQVGEVFEPDCGVCVGKGMWMEVRREEAGHRRKREA